MRLFRVILPVGDIDAAAGFYRDLLGGSPGERVTSGRHYFDCEGTLLALWDPLADGDPRPVGPNRGYVYLATTEPLDQVRQRAVAGGAVPDPLRGEIDVRPWRERSFYLHDPWGNPVCLVQQGTEYLGGEFAFS
jgi:catechol 2,3-dioxygenase-like lactoylglutathione lyase family enzyme